MAIQVGLSVGKTVVMSIKVENEGKDLSAYFVGTTVKCNLPVPEAYNMATETVIATLMWILGQTNDRRKIVELLCTPVS